jgi:peptidoglycan/LPS O-acetylase OafA/YrhL
VSAGAIALGQADQHPAGATPEHEASSGIEAGKRRPRLTHVDAMRPMKQFGVVITHSLNTFALTAGVGAGAALMVSHVTRFAFMFISAAMFVYAYPRLGRQDLRRFWRRRLLSIAVPYVAWTLVYFAMEAGSVSWPLGGVKRLGYLLATGYYQLYFLLLLLEFCLVYPAFLWLLRRTEGHHWALFASSVALQVVLTSLIYWGIQPGWALGKGGGMIELWNYQLFLVAGGLLAWHYAEAHEWLCRHWRLVLAATVGGFVVAEVYYVFVEEHPGSLLAGTVRTAAFQPVTIPLYLGLIASIYLIGVALMHARRSPRTRMLVQAGADNSYGVYLSQVLVLTAVTWLGWGRLTNVMPWPVVTLGGAIVVFGLATALTSILSRLPGARALAGRPRQSWRPTLALQPASGEPPARNAVTSLLRSWATRAAIQR